MKKLKSHPANRNFDDLAEKFQRKVYGGVKGRVRLEILKRDLTQFYPGAVQPAGTAPLKILDAGGGYGPFSLTLAQLGHQVLICDISEKMLEKAQAVIEEKNINATASTLKCAIQDLADTYTESFDLVLCHAVIDWVKDPVDLIHHLILKMKKKGVLSLTFYNIHGMILKNLLRTNYKKIVKEEFSGWPGSLTPTFPRDPGIVRKWLEEQRLEILTHSGIRVFHDYVLDLADREKSPDTVLELELKFSRQLPYRDIGRYQHILCRKGK